MKHDFAKTLRRDQTDVERMLWYALRSRRFHGFKFRRQQPVGPYIADFVCFDRKYIVELDGSQHETPVAKKADSSRTERLAQDGFKIRRFRNRDLIEGFEGVLERIWLDLGAPQSELVPYIEEKAFRPSRYVRKK